MTDIKEPKITKAKVKKLIEVIDKGLCKGLGEPEPGHMCVEAAVCYALGLPHSDEPVCVSPALRAFKIGLNDANWSSNEARAKGMRQLAVLQLGTNKAFDEKEFVKKLAIANVNFIIAELPFLSEEIRKECRGAKTLDAAGYAAESAAGYAAESARYAARYAAESARYAAESARYAARYAAESARYAARYAAESAGYAAGSARYAARYAAESAAGSARYAARDKVLNTCATMAVNILIDMGVSAIKYLDLL